MTRRQTPDGELVAGARGGDRRAFAALVERHYGVLVATCRRATGDAELAADAAQEGVVTALVGLDRLRDPERFGAWLIGIGLNLCRRALQERARWAHAAGLEPPAPGPGSHEAAEAAQIAERVRAAIAALPAGKRADALRRQDPRRRRRQHRGHDDRKRRNCHEGPDATQHRTRAHPPSGPTPDRSQSASATHIAPQRLRGVKCAFRWCGSWDRKVKASKCLQISPFQIYMSDPLRKWLARSF